MESNIRVEEAELSESCVVQQAVLLKSRSLSAGEREQARAPLEIESQNSDN
jgi:hypothetical protein